ncbi:uracil phosphoribosyltransferase [bacterium (Candidatus Blackallbacteria) CG17_big_fil_post_rev_8_21_14_2_50_48_46]|uniref:Uracil phosphoribosyltransferase n=1 Tax=bacterium (Candidatus Blackallbacteria) CG17_big_fil_post_rev_8_21_14_2_50_48_46 TaxID=2014261 RepID=A0A2M7G8P5_9BACT|nr:MAG: uracil phosphoribosyltransferase [bacterium (Candidatus Blackallbacteria) CG18_big_fil_WC_8_21_14_2_50_49_26]PIW18201.1 MAG: uracil phosphoribosyltransferase [bacterium (Candidatus Blackallbacteria) CG17_big_fil_post_rev_8_21_14_2_50_48_46]PIW50632.1 MAG: uracil phosphoribosyltransferase [bacterium (Candidatus Blackallbacteria) CG13_big_fil_rev_8_21_14_2_50_49_14]
MLPDNLFVHDHPLIQRDMTLLRDKNTPSPIFRAMIKNLARYIVYEASSKLELAPQEVETPLGPCLGKRIKCSHIVLAPILRAGLCMIDGAFEVFPFAQVRHIGLYRNEETLLPVEYYVKIPEELAADTLVFILDPMLATGGSAIAAVDILKKRKVTNIHFCCLIASPEGIQKLSEAHPDIKIHTTSVDQGLNEIGYILPGLGDAGDRAFNT